MSDSCKGRKSTLLVKDQRTIHDCDLHIRDQKTNVWTRTFIFLLRTKIIKIDVVEPLVYFAFLFFNEKVITKETRNSTRCDPEMQPAFKVIM